MATDCLSYRDIAHPSYKDVIRAHNNSTLKLVKTVAEFAQKISAAHEQFAAQIHNVVDLFHKRNQDLKKERGPSLNQQNSSHNIRRPAECQNTLTTAWENLLEETQIDAQAHADTASLLIKNVCNPLLEIATYKKSQAKKLYAFRENFEVLLSTADTNTDKAQMSYSDTYQLYRSNVNAKDNTKLMSAYCNVHNNYLLQVASSNCLQEQYHTTALPYLLEELEEIHIDLANTLTGAIESHALLLLTKATEQSKRFEGILNVCNKQVNPKMDIHKFLAALSEQLVLYTPKTYSYVPPTDSTAPEAGLLKEEVLVDRHTEPSIQSRKQELQKEAAELTSYLKQNQDITQTLISVCQRNLAMHQYAKVYETQEDLCRKRNEIRMANLQLAAIRAQIDMLSPKANGRAMDESSDAKSEKSSIRGMWKKAFKSLKKDRDKDKDKEEKGDREDKRYSKMNSRQSSVKKGLLKRKDSKEQAPPGNITGDDEQHLANEVGEIDPVYSLLKCAADLPRQSKMGHSCCLQRVNDNLTVPMSNSRSSSPSSGSMRGTTSNLSIKSELNSTASSPRVGSTGKIGTRMRRVQFQQDSRKSQSLETPYHHTHQQHKLGRDMESEVTERSHSYSSLAPPVNTALPSRGAPLTHQDSHSGENISGPEKWEDEGGVEYIKLRSRKQHKAHPARVRKVLPTVSTAQTVRAEIITVDDPQKSEMMHLAVVQPQRSKPRELRHQRSYSTGDLSPTIEKWERESVTDSTRKTVVKGKTAQKRESPREEAKKTTSDRRKGWVKQKQKSKSFDFSWRVGSMWSPVEDRKSYRGDILLMQSEPRRPRPKPPSMLELDSGSSYESRDINFAKSEYSMPKSEVAIKKSLVNMNKPQVGNLDSPAVSESMSQGRLARPETKTQGPDRRRSVFTERRSHSLESSVEEYTSSSQEKDHGPDADTAVIHYKAMTVHDRRLKLQEQRRSRSLDTYEPASKATTGSPHVSDGTRADDIAARTRRASDFTSIRASRKMSDVVLAVMPRRTSDVQKSPSRHGTEMSPRSSGGKRAGEVISGSPSTRESTQHGGSPSTKRVGETPTRPGSGNSPSQGRPTDHSGSPIRHSNETNRRRSEASTKGTTAQKAFTQQKSFSFEVSHYPISEHKVQVHQAFGESNLTSSPKTRVKGRMLPRIPGESGKTEHSPESPQHKQVDKFRAQDKRAHFADQKSFSYETTAYSSHPQNALHRNSEPVISEVNRKRDYMEEGEMPNIALDRGYPSGARPPPKPKQPSPEMCGNSLEHGNGRVREVSPRSLRSRNARQEAVDRISAGRAATSPAAFSMSAGSMQQSSLSQIAAPQVHQSQRIPSPQREGVNYKSSPTSRLRKSESIATGHDSRSEARSRGSHHSPQDQRERRKKFSDQKSFSYEVATTYRPFSNDELGDDYAQVTRARTARDKRLIMMKTRASHSLDDIDFQKQITQAQGVPGAIYHQPYRQFAPPLGYMYMGQYATPQPEPMLLRPRRYDSSHSRSPSRSPDRRGERDASPRSRNKLMMLHSMKAVAHDGNNGEPVTQATHEPTATLHPHMPPHIYHAPIPGQDFPIPPDQAAYFSPSYYEPMMYAPQHFFPAGYYPIDDRFQMPKGYPSPFISPQGYMEQPKGDLNPGPPDEPHVPPKGDSQRNPQEAEPSRSSSLKKEEEEEREYEKKPVVSGPQPAVLIKALPRDALRKDRYSDGKPFWKFWKS